MKISSPLSLCAILYVFVRDERTPILEVTSSPCSNSLDLLVFEAVVSRGRDISLNFATNFNPFVTFLRRNDMRFASLQPFTPVFRKIIELVTIDESR